MDDERPTPPVAFASIDPHRSRFSAPLAVMYGILMVVAGAGFYAGSELQRMRNEATLTNQKIIDIKATMVTRTDLTDFARIELRQQIRNYFRELRADCVLDSSLGRGHFNCELSPRRRDDLP